MAGNVHRQKGIALVTVLISVAIITGLVSNLAYQQFIQSRRTAVVLHSEQAIMYLFAVEAYAKIVLNLDSVQNAIDWYGETEPWGREINNPFEGGTIGAAIIDLDGRFNLNNLYRVPSSEEINTGKRDINLTSIWNDCYRQLITPYLDEFSAADKLPSAEELTSSLADWLDPDVDPRPGGAEEAYYQSPSDLGGSYKPANHLLGDVHELALIKGYEELFAQENAPTLLRQISVLPTTTATININTATPQVLGCLEPTGRLSGEIANRITSTRTTTPFESVSDMISLLDSEFSQEKEVVTNGQRSVVQVPWEELLPVKFLAVKSNFVLLRSELSFGYSNLVAFTLLQRTNDGSVRVLRRTFSPN